MSDDAAREESGGGWVLPGAGAAWIGGRPASLEEAASEAASLLGRSKAPLVAGLETDVAGAEAAVALARVLGAALDHARAGAALRDLDVMRQHGWIVTTPLQARARADLVLLVGPELDAAWPDLARRLDLDRPPALFPDRPRRVIRLCPGPAGGGTGETAGGDPAELPVLLGVLRALLGGRPVAPDAPEAEALGRCAAALAAARYGVAVWSASAMDELAIEMLCGIIDDLNATTRFAGLPLAGGGNEAGGNATGVVQAAGWLTGFPVRTGFARAVPEHDPWRFDAARLAASGEADAALFVSALGAAPPSWTGNLPTVALAAPGTRFAAAPAVALAIGRPWVDHDGVMHDPDLGALAFRAASAPTDLPAAADALARISAAMGGAAPC